MQKFGWKPSGKETTWETKAKMRLRLKWLPENKFRLSIGSCGGLLL
jgi:hypothetical protein